jgi:hypothetical protein
MLAKLDVSFPEELEVSQDEARQHPSSMAIVSYRSCNESSAGPVTSVRTPAPKTESINATSNIYLECKLAVAVAEYVR